MLEGHPNELLDMSNIINFDLFTYHNSRIALGNKKGQIDTLFILNLSNTNKYFYNDKNDLKLFPNPASSQITLTLSDEYISEPQIDIIDNLGFIHEPKYQINSNEITINTSSLSPGVYFLRIRSGGQVETKKFVVVR